MILKQKPSLMSRPKVRNIVIAGLIVFALFAFWQKDFILVNFFSHGVVVSPRENFYSEPTEIKLNTLLSGDILYTTDGTEPDSDSGSASTQKYQGSFVVSEPVVLRYSVFKNGRKITPTQDHDILVNTEHDLPIVTINTEPENLWDPEIGIYVDGNHKNFLQTGKEWERPAEINFYDEDQQLVFSRHIGLRLHGNNMRKMPQKLFRVYFQNDEGRQHDLKYPLFGPDGNAEYASVILRTGGDPKTLIRDRVAGSLVAEGSDLTVQKSRPVVLYLNGKYWGLYYLYERFDETYFAEKFQVKPKALSVIEVPLRGYDVRGLAVPDTKNSNEDADKYNTLLANVRKCDHCGNYFDLDLFLDMENLIDYYIFEMFFDNVDWPYNNAKAWRYTSEEFTPEAGAIPELDGRLRWLFFDLDASLGSTSTNADEIINSAENDPYDKLIDKAFPLGNMFNNATFAEIYQERAITLVDTTLRADNMIRVADQLAEEIRSEIPRHLSRWNEENQNYDIFPTSTQDDWENAIALLKIYLKERPNGFSTRTHEFFYQGEMFDSGEFFDQEEFFNSTAE